MRSELANKILGDNDVVKALTLNDFSMNASGAISSVIFTLFVIKQIDGGIKPNDGILLTFAGNESIGWLKV